MSTSSRNSVRAIPFTYAGVSFEILCDGRVGTPGIAEDLKGEIEEGHMHGAAAHVVCSVSADPSLAEQGGSSVHWDEDRAAIEAAQVRATMTKLEPRLYVASGRIGPSLAKIRPLLDALAAAVLAAEAV